MVGEETERGEEEEVEDVEEEGEELAIKHVNPLVGEFEG